MMFARTKRLLLRPGWIEDAPALAEALGDERIARAASSIPFPYALSDAQDFLSRPPVVALPRLLMFERGDADSRLVGGIDLSARAGRVTLGYWVRTDRWGAGLATEAGHAMLAIAEMLGHRDLHATWFIDNPASGAVLNKLGFAPLGEMRLCTSRGRSDPAFCRAMRRQTAERSAIPAPIAA